MALIVGGAAPLAYSGSTPSDEHCPHCSGCDVPLGHCLDETCSPEGLPVSPDAGCHCLCARCRNADRLICGIPEEHVPCGRCLAEARAAEVEYQLEDR